MAVVAEVDEGPPLVSAQVLMVDYEWYGAVAMQTWAAEGESSCGVLNWNSCTSCARGYAI